MQKVFAVFDVKAAAYSNPVFLPTTGLASRMFVEQSSDPKSPVAMYPGDYSLYELGTYDPCSGKLTALPEPVLVMSGAAALAKPVEEVKA